MLASTCPLKVQVSQGLGSFFQVELFKMARKTSEKFSRPAKRQAGARVLAQEAGLRRASWGAAEDSFFVCTKRLNLRYEKEELAKRNEKKHVAKIQIHWHPLIRGVAAQRHNFQHSREQDEPQLEEWGLRFEESSEPCTQITW